MSMTEYAGLFLRTSAGFEVPELSLDHVLRRRDRKRRRQRIAAGVVGVAVALFGVLVASSVIRSEPQGTGHVVPPRNGPITFLSEERLTAVMPDGSPLGEVHRPFLGPAGIHMAMDWSPDGRRLAHSISDVRGESSNEGLYLHVAGTEGSRRISREGAQSVDWSPDGRLLVYSSFTAIRVATDEGDLVGTVWSGTGYALSPSWSADGRSIAFAVYAGGRSSIRIHDASGRYVRTLIEDPDGDLLVPAWSPDGSRIAYLHGCSVRDIALDGSGGRILISHIDGCGRRHVRRDAIPWSWSDHQSLIWSPDGTKLAFNLFVVADGFPLFVMDADGTDLLRVPVPLPAQPPIAWRPVPQKE
jgi:dipeptidyl aminopeptidase/acylaminoacyl peptidase